MSTQTGHGAVPQWTRGDRLRKARSVTGKTTREFAALIGVSQKTVTDAEGDKRETRKVVLNAWSMATGVPIEWLLWGVEPTGPEGVRGEPLTFGSEGWEFESLRARHLHAVGSAA